MQTTARVFRLNVAAAAALLFIGCTVLPTVIVRSEKRLNPVSNAAHSLGASLVDKWVGETQSLEVYPKLLRQRKDADALLQLPVQRRAEKILEEHHKQQLVQHALTEARAALADFSKVHPTQLDKLVAPVLQSRPSPRSQQAPPRAPISVLATQQKQPPQMQPPPPPQQQQPQTTQKARLQMKAAELRYLSEPFPPYAGGVSGIVASACGFDSSPATGPYSPGAATAKFRRGFAASGSSSAASNLPAAAQPSVCGGPSRGICDPYLRVCRCLPGYTGSSCQVKCPTDQGGAVCSGHGVCALNMATASACRCFCGNGVRYFGPKCEQAAPLDNMVWCQRMQPDPVTSPYPPAYGQPTWPGSTVDFPQNDPNASTYPSPSVYAGAAYGALNAPYSGMVNPALGTRFGYTGPQPQPVPNFGMYGEPQPAPMPLINGYAVGTPMEGGYPQAGPPGVMSYPQGHYVWVGPQVSALPPPIYGTMSPITKGTYPPNTGI